MKRAFGTVALLSSFVAVGCSDGDTPQSGTQPGVRPVVLGEKTTVVDKGSVDKVDTTQEGRLVFPKAGFESLLTRKAGDILVGDRQSKAGGKNPQGFLRKVVSVTQEGEAIVVTTQPALLTDALKSGSFTGTLQIPELGPTGPVPAGSAPGLDQQNLSKMTNLLKFEGIQLLDLNETVKVGADDIGFHLWAKTTKGTVDFKPKFDVGADLDGFSLKEFHAIGTGKLTSEVELDAGLELTTSLDGDKLALLIAQAITKKPSKTLFEYPMDLGSLQIGPIPLPASADFKLDLECELIWSGGAKVLVGAKAEAFITAGIKYENGDISPVWDSGASLVPTGPAWTLDGSVKVRCDLKPHFDLKFFGVASAGIWADAYGVLDAKVQCSNDQLAGTVTGEAWAGASAGVYADVNVFGLYKWKKECSLFDVESTHATASGTFTLPGGKNGTCSSPPPLAEREKPDPKKCFGNEGTGGSGGMGGFGTGGSGGDVADAGDAEAADACVPLPADSGVTLPAGWTCEEAKWGDCNCDCNCGAIDEHDCATGQCAGCTHDECTTGEALSPTCNSCTKAVCDHDSYCCDVEWGGSCTISVEQYCGKTCQ
ncbi:MAG TPA: hypothetical protein PLI95_21130 [Polyangiaceae bacterium]|nr:hypothetical protein [Polyangiaceae bacterium]